MNDLEKSEVRRKIGWPLTASFVIHLLLALLVFVLAKPYLVKPPVRRPQTRIEVELTPVFPPMIHGSRTGKSHEVPNASKAQIKPKAFGIEDFGLSTPPSLETARGDEKVIKGDPNSEIFSGISGYEVFRRMKIETDTRIYPVLNAIHRKIINTTDYPEVLVEHGRVGRVYVQFEVDARGQLISSFTNVVSEDPYLKFHVLRCIREALREPLSGSQDLPMGKLRIATVFHFDIFPHQSWIPDEEPSIVKNTMKFYRHVVRSNIPITPMMPGQAGFPGAAGLNLHILKTLKLLSGPEGSIDPFQ